MRWRKAMAKHPSERFESYDDFRMALEAARSQVPGRPGPASQAKRPRQKLVAALKKRENGEWR